MQNLTFRISKLYFGFKVEKVFFEKGKSSFQIFLFFSSTENSKNSKSNLSFLKGKFEEKKRISFKKILH